ncbi:hypothetical protein NQZ68_003926 [Dissostichus eleginoides]|nr:hypothetical protein NQZ68_003926 [Dissostichus eleginoides]
MYTPNCGAGSYTIHKCNCTGPCRGQVSASQQDQEPIYQPDLLGAERRALVKSVSQSRAATIGTRLRQVHALTLPKTSRLHGQISRSTRSFIGSGLQALIALCSSELDFFLCAPLYHCWLTFWREYSNNMGQSVTQYIGSFDSELMISRRATKATTGIRKNILLAEEKGKAELRRGLSDRMYAGCRTWCKRRACSVKAADGSSVTRRWPLICTQWEQSSAAGRHGRHDSSCWEGNGRGTAHL